MTNQTFVGEDVAVRPSKRHSVSGEVGAYLERLIVDLAPGDRLPPERYLAQTLDVSRTSVREAMHELEQRRVVERRPGRGTTVRERSLTARAMETGLDAVMAEQGDVAELRLLVEPQVAGLAARRASATDLVLLDETLAASHAGLTPHESLVLDVQFHLRLAEAARNPLLVSLCRLTADWVHDVRGRSHTTRAGRRVSVDGHRAVFRAVAAGDSESASLAMVAHLDDVAGLVR